MKTGLLLLMALSTLASAEDFADRCSDRLAIERVYHLHRLGEKSAFEQVVPHALIEHLVRHDQRMETVLKRVYNVEVWPAMIAEEVKRINSTTRAPDVLAELRAALGDDPARFDRSIAKPTVVERLLRERFDSDPQLHATRRQEAEKTRNELLAARKAGSRFEDLLALLKRSHSNNMSETAWQLGPTQIQDPGVDPQTVHDRHASPTANEQVVPESRERKLWFADLPRELQLVLQAQLRHPADVSAVIETPDGFLLYVAREATRDTLNVATLALPKCRFEQWLAEQNEETQESARTHRPLLASTHPTP